MEEGTRFMVLAPIVRGRKGEYGKQLAELRAEGFTRVKVDGELRLLEEEIVLDKKYKHDISVVVDRLSMKPDLRKRLADSVETAVALAEGIIDVETVPRDGSEPVVTSYSERFACLHCGISMPEPEPRLFSFNSRTAARAATAACRWRSTRSWSCRIRRCRSTRARSCRGRLAPRTTTTRSRRRSPSATRSTSTPPWFDLPEDMQDLFLYGTNGDRIYVSYRKWMGCKRSYMTSFEGIVPNLERRYKETDSDWSREKIEEYMSVRPCSECKGKQVAAARVAGGQGRRPGDPRVHPPEREALAGVARGLELSSQDRAIARLILREIDERLRFLDNVGVGYLSMDRAAATLSGGEAQRIRLATQIAPRWSACSTSSTSRRSGCTSATTSG